jgi:hypothetical protein
MLSLIYSRHDEAAANALRERLTTAGYTIGSVSPKREDPVIVLLSPTALNDQDAQNALFSALDVGHHIIPVTTEPMTLPKYIDHLTPVDRTHFEALRAAIEAAQQPDAGLSLKVLTPSTRRSNTRAGLVVGLIAFGMFIVGVIGIAVFNIEAPLEEYNLVDTEVAQTRDILIAPTLEGYLRYLPGSLEQAAEYPATVQAVPTRIRPFVAATATAVAIDQGN